MPFPRLNVGHACVAVWNILDTCGRFVTFLSVLSATSAGKHCCSFDVPPSHISALALRRVEVLANACLQPAGSNSIGLTSGSPVFNQLRSFFKYFFYVSFHVKRNISAKKNKPNKGQQRSERGAGETWQIRETKSNQTKPSHGSNRVHAQPAARDQPTPFRNLSYRPCKTKRNGKQGATATNSASRLNSSKKCVTVKL